MLRQFDTSQRFLEAATQLQDSQVWRKPHVIQRLVESEAKMQDFEIGRKFHALQTVLVAFTKDQHLQFLRQMNALKRLVEDFAKLKSLQAQWPSHLRRYLEVHVQSQSLQPLWKNFCKPVGIDLRCMCLDVEMSNVWRRYFTRRIEDQLVILQELISKMQ